MMSHTSTSSHGEQSSYKGLHRSIEAQAALRPDAVAIVYEEQSLTYGQLNESANQLAHLLIAFGVTPESLVPILLERSVQMIIGILGVLKAGAAYVPLDPAHPSERLTFMLKESQAQILITQQSVLEYLPAFEGRIFCLEKELDSVARQGFTSNPEVRFDSDNPCYLIYTSGSTGRPKGVLICHRNVLRLFDSTQPWFEIDENDVWTLFHSYTFDFSVWEIFGALLYGGRLVITPHWVARTPEAFRALLRDEQVTVLNQTPSSFFHLMATDSDGKESVRYRALSLVIFGGEALDAGALRSWFSTHGDQHPLLVNMYGITETTVHVTYHPLAIADSEGARASMIGESILDLQLHIFDEQMNPMPIEITGEFYISGEGLARGYFNRPELTAERFVPNPSQKAAGERLYRTGDLGRLQPDGNVEYIGRLDNQVKIRGFRIELGEIESILIRHPEVRGAVVVARESAARDKQLIAYVVTRSAGNHLNEGSGQRVSEVENSPSFTDAFRVRGIRSGIAIDSDAMNRSTPSPRSMHEPAFDSQLASHLRKFLRDQLPDYMIPSGFMFLDHLPLTSSGKLDRKSLPDPTAVALADRFIELRTPIEELLEGIFAQLLEVEKVALDDNFFEKGGHSLLATQVVSRIREVLGVEVGVRGLFERPTVRGLAELIEEQRGGGGNREAVARIAAVSREGELPLSYAQQRLWFIQQLEPDSTLYNVGMAVRLKGESQGEAIRQSLDELRRRQEVLRTRIQVRGGQAYQQIEVASGAGMAAEWVDVSGLEEGERQEEVRRLLGEEVGRKFEVEGGRLWRARLLRESEQEQVLAVTMHHIISDGWSVGVMIKELGESYEAMSRGGAVPGMELAVQYADYAVWQRENMKGERLEQEMSYWREQLAELPVLELPTDRPRPTNPTYQGQSVAFHSSSALLQELKDFSRREGVTLFMTFLAGLQVTLGRYANQEDFGIGAPVANRNRVETEKIIGCFVNQLVLRSTLSKNITAHELLRQVRETTLAAYANQDVPFEKIVEELNVLRDQSHSPLFQVELVMQNALSREIQIGGVEIAAIPSDFHPAKFDLTFIFHETEDAIIGSAEYATDLYDRTSIERLLQQVRMVLAAMAEEGEQRLGSLPQLSRGQRQQLLVEWNDSEQAFAEPASLPELFQQQARRTPDAIAVSSAEGQLSYGGLNGRANQMAHYLMGLGVQAEVRVGLLLGRSPAMVEAVLAVLKAGAAYVPLERRYPPQRLAYMLEDAISAADNPYGLVISDAPGPWQQVRVLNLGAEAEAAQIRQMPTTDPAVGVSGEQLAYVIYTSGSTGRPKAVAVTHRGLRNLALAQSPLFAIRPGVAVLQFSSLCFDASASEIATALSAGARLVLPPKQEMMVGDQLSEVLCREQIEVATLPPSVLASLPEVLTCHPRTLVVAGEAVGEEMVRRWAPGRRMLDAYGPTEASVCATVSGDLSREAEVRIGRGIGNVKVYVAGGVGEEAGIGARGEIYIGGEGVARGYLGKAEETAERFVPDWVSGVAGGRLYRTGDEGRWDAGGEVEYLGRKDGQVKVRGYRIELGEIEEQLQAEAGIRQAAVVVQGSGAEQRLIGYVVKEEGARQSEAELRRRLSERLPEYMVPVRVVEMEEMPLTANGKLDRRGLPEPGVETGRETGVGEQTAIEELVSGIFGEVLKQGQVGVGDNFFELGGHSLLATQVVSRIREVLGVEVGVRAVFEKPTVRGLAELIEQQRGSNSHEAVARIPVVSREGELPLSYAQQRLWFIQQLEPDSAAYNIAYAVRLKGKSQGEAIRQSLNELRRRQEVLRTRIGVRGGQAYQQVEAASGAGMVAEWVDVSGLEEGERQGEVRRLLGEEAGRKFKVEGGRLWRARMLREREQEEVLAVTMHHIISDGWSVGVMIKELGESYEAMSCGRAVPGVELAVQYADYAVWQRENMKGEGLEQEMSYWREQLAELPVLELPTEPVMPNRSSRSGAIQAFRLSPEQTQAVKELSRREGVTLFMTLLAAFDVVLSRYCGQEDIVVGTDIANRHGVQTEGLIGFFINQLVLRSDLRGNPRFSELLWRVREMALSAYANQEVPFEKLVEEMQPQRDLLRSPLFQVKLVLQNAFLQQLPPLSLKCEAMEIQALGVKVVMNLLLSETENGLSGFLNYDADLIRPLMARKLLDHFRTVLTTVASNAHQPINEIQLLNDAERHQLVIEWSDTRQDFQNQISILEMFEKHAEDSPDVVATVYEDDYLTYGELNSRSNKLAHYLRRCGVEAELRVALCMERSLDQIIGLLSVLKAGGAYVPIDSTLPAARMESILNDSQAVIFLTQEHLRGNLPAIWLHVLCVDSEQDQWASESPFNPGVVNTGSSLAYVIYTSGSTGKPKAVGIEHRQLANYVQAVSRRFELQAEWRFALVSSLAADLGLTMLYGSLCVGGQLHVVSQASSREVEGWTRYCAQRQVDCVKMTPSQMGLIMGGREGMPRRRLILGGEACSVEAVREAGEWRGECEVNNHYGPSECTVGVLTSRLGGGKGEVRLGKPMSNMEVYVMGEGGEMAGVGMAGELWIGGRGVGRGYVNDVKKTAAAYQPDWVSGAAGGRLYRTGDEGRWDAGGEVEYLGRKDGQVKVRGYRIELGEIEQQLQAEAGIRQAVVVVQGSGAEQRLIGYVVKEAGARQSEAELRRRLSERLPEYMVPVRVVEMEEMPLTGNGKLDRRRLPEPGVETSREAVAGEQTAIEELVSGIFGEVLKLGQVGVGDNFFELGGHSLLATQVVSRIREVLGVEVGVRGLFEKPTVRGLAELIEEQRGGGGNREAVAHIPVVSREGELPLSYAQQRLWFIQQLEPDSTAYNIPYAVRLKGELDVCALEQSLNQIERRHEVLRTRIGAQGMRLQQIISPPKGMNIPFWDVSAEHSSSREDQARAIIEKEVIRPFDLQQGPVWRVGLIKLEANEHVLFLCIHHIATDAWSLGVLVKEFATLYESSVRGKTTELTDLPIQYVDFAVWEREWLQGDVLEQQVRYWKTQLEGLPLLRLFKNGSKAPGLFHAAEMRFKLPCEATQAVKELSRREGVTLFMTLLAAFDVVLSRYCGQEDIVVGTDIANRHGVQTEGLIGFFINQLVLRSDLSGNPRFSELLGRVREMALSAYAHQEVPFEKLVEEMQPQRDLLRSPLFQVKFVFQNVPQTSIELPGLSLEPFTLNLIDGKVALKLTVGEVAGEIVGVFGFNRRIISQNQVGMLAAELQELLMMIPAHCEQSLEALNEKLEEAIALRRKTGKIQLREGLKATLSRKRRPPSVPLSPSSLRLEREE